MSRIELGGLGDPIPTLALPPAGSESDIPPTLLTFTDSADFSVLTYRDLGFTHFEVWCVGAAGGRGGDTADPAQPVQWISEDSSHPVPQSVWDYEKERQGLFDYYKQVDDYYQEPSRYRPALWNRRFIAGSQNTWPVDVTKIIYPPSGDFYRYMELITEYEFHFIDSNQPVPLIWANRGVTGLTYMEAFELKYPTHVMNFTEYEEALLWPAMKGMGGGGGGGGFHKANGVLEDLPAVVPVVVGKAGADADYGQVVQHSPWTPMPPHVSDSNPLPAGSVTNASTPVSAYPARQAELERYLGTYVTSYPAPRSIFLNPGEGEDGGLSSFADDICLASGGEGGKPGMLWSGSAFAINGNGGAGGLGGQAEPGGGGAGSIADGVNGSDGLWIPETGIGGGGGGGKGGRQLPPAGFPPVAGRQLASAGGQGSYSFADTSVYGARQFRQPWTYTRPDNGAVVTDSSNLVTPGGGGGARPFPNLKYGGRGAGFSPDGIVVLRLTRVT